MPLHIPTLDDRRYQGLLDEALARIPVHNPDWTNFNKSDPGVTLLEVFAFLTENLLYRSNQIPERNRKKFLSLLGVPLQPATSARGLVTITHESGLLQTITLNDSLEVLAGQVPFRTEKGLDVLPVEAQVYYKRKLVNPSPQIQEYYRQLYASYNLGQGSPDPAVLQLYETVPLDSANTNGVAIGAETVDGSLWIALLTRAQDKPADITAPARDALLKKVREEIAQKTISLGAVPALDAAERSLTPGGQPNPEAETLLQYEIPNVPAGGELPPDRKPRYKSLVVASPTDIFAHPGVVEITLPTADELQLWSNIDPLESGVGDFPPALEDTNLNNRLITWIRIRSSVAAVRARLLWVGINAVFVTQRAHVSREVLPDGTGEPDQAVVLSQRPIVGKVRLFVTAVDGEPHEWEEIDDLLSAGQEVQVPNLRQPPGVPLSTDRPIDVFTVNPESGEIKFGDGLRGRRPPLGATMRASYDHGAGTAGNVAKGSINNGPILPAGLKVTNPVRTWNGADSEGVVEGEKQIARYLQHRDRLVSAVDFETLTLRTPGVAIGRVEVIPAFNPELAPNVPGDAGGAVTLMLIPRFDLKQPDAPVPDGLFLDAVCRYLDPRRLVTTEIFLRGPVYKQIWLSVGINVVAGASIAQVREEVKASLLRFLSPLRQSDSRSLSATLESQSTSLNTPQYADLQKGWPLSKPVTDRELLAVASRVSGVLLVNDVKIAEGTKQPDRQIPMNGLELPRVMGISVAIGEPPDLDQLRGQTAATATVSGTAPTTTTAPIIQVPFIPGEC
jgi:hypothetical protein